MIMHKTNMHNCWFCKNPLRPWAEWKGNDEHFYCNEFCADDAEEVRFRRHGRAERKAHQRDFFF